MKRGARYSCQLVQPAPVTLRARACPSAAGQREHAPVSPYIYALSVPCPNELPNSVGRILPDGYDGELLVEEFLGSAGDILAVSYNAMVQDDGRTYTLCAGRHFLHAGKFYMGSSLGVGAMPDDCAAKVRKAGEAIGEATAAGGYRGPLNVDFLYREPDGTLFPLEINPRRGLGGILSDMCISLFGQGYEKAVSAVVVHSLPVSNSITAYAQLRDCLLRQGFFGRESRGLVIAPYSMSALAAKSEFGLAVFGTDGTSAEAALGEITGYLAPRPRRIRVPRAFAAAG